MDKNSIQVTKHIRLSRKTLAMKIKLHIWKYVNIRANNDEKQKKIIVAQVCEDTGISPKKLAMYANNKFTVMDVRELKIIALALNVNIDQLVSYEDESAKS